MRSGNVTGLVLHAGIKFCILVPVRKSLTDKVRQKQTPLECQGLHGWSLWTTDPFHPHVKHTR